MDVPKQPGSPYLYAEYTNAWCGVQPSPIYLQLSFSALYHRGSPYANWCMAFQPAIPHTFFLLSGYAKLSRVYWSVVLASLDLPSNDSPTSLSSPHLKAAVAGPNGHNQPCVTQIKHEDDFEVSKVEIPFGLEGQDQTFSDRTSMLGDTKAWVRTYREDRSVQSPSASTFRAPVATLHFLETELASDSKILFYFGVLTTQEHLLPRFYLTRSSKTDNWGIKMTMYGTTFIRSHVYISSRSAKAAVCREALKKLKAEFPDWPIPERPKHSIAPPNVNWVAILHDYCEHQGLSQPRYTKYVHHKGYRHEVEVSGGTYFGSLKYYPEELLSTQGAAHVALYDLLVSDADGSPELENLSGLKTSTKHSLSSVPRDSLHSRNPVESYVPARRRLEDRRDTRKAKSRQRTARSRSPITANANLQPLENCRLVAVDAPVTAEARRWKVSPPDILRQLETIESWITKLEKTCDLLSLEHPEIRVERMDGRLVDTEGEYIAAAHFKSDPFLARAGGIGQVHGTYSSKNSALEACVRQVCDYLIKMVEEDMELEDKASAEKKAIATWPERVT
ncbi:hypothetical protein BJY04DRAFT_223958 [Aspergillus karnatakaensis]|uniref:uncharacterized protein n=1 Tax=Aspergillus karnatakaensis TaxID=1810916 RepID=UPI003CCDD208